MFTICDFSLVENTMKSSNGNEYLLYKFNSNIFPYCREYFYFVAWRFQNRDFPLRTVIPPKWTI